MCELRMEMNLEITNLANTKKKNTEARGRIPIHKCTAFYSSSSSSVSYPSSLHLEGPFRLGFRVLPRALRCFPFFLFLSKVIFEIVLGSALKLSRLASHFGIRQ